MKNLNELVKGIINHDIDYLLNSKNLEDYIGLDFYLEYDAN